jgi:hypothetical protein
MINYNLSTHNLLIPNIGNPLPLHITVHLSTLIRVFPDIITSTTSRSWSRQNTHHTLSTSSPSPTRMCTSHCWRLPGCNKVTEDPEEDIFWNCQRRNYSMLKDCCENLTHSKEVKVLDYSPKYKICNECLQGMKVRELRAYNHRRFRQELDLKGL